MNFIQRWRLRRRLMEGSAVVEERIRKRLETLQQKLEKRSDDLEKRSADLEKRQRALEAQAKNQTERTQQLSRQAANLTKRAESLNEKSANLDEKADNLEKRRVSLDEQINILVEERTKLQEFRQEVRAGIEADMETKANRLTKRQEMLDQKAAQLEEKRLEQESKFEGIFKEKNELIQLKHEISDELQRDGRAQERNLDFDFGGYVETKFSSTLDDLINRNDSELALDHLISEFPVIARSKLNRKEKLNHFLYSSQRIRRTGIAKHGWEKLLRKANTANRAFSESEIDKNSTFLDLGCGAHDPIALSAYYYLNGFERTIACDLQDARNPVYSALSMYDILAHMHMFPKDFCLEGTHGQLFKNRLGELQAKKFSDGQWDEALAALHGKVEHKAMNVLDLPVAHNELGFATSFAVLEHVEDIDAVVEWLYRKSKPGAVQFHFIDMADHRSYTPDSGANAWSFLTEETAPEGMNRLRKSEHIAAVQNAGFRILSQKQTKDELPDETMAGLLEPWKSMSAEDLQTTKLTLVIQK